MSQSENPYYGGGGYLAGSPYGSTSGSPSGRKNEAAHALRPVTITQIKKASQIHADAEWMLDDAEVGQITTIGTVVLAKEQATNVVYELDDGTGRIESRHWVDSTNARAEGLAEESLQDKYVRVIGTIKVFSGKRYINATHISPIKDQHELYFHLLEAMMTTLIHERGPPPRNQDGKQAPNGNAMSGGPSAYMAQPNNNSYNNEYANLPPLEQKVIHYMLQQPVHDEGIHCAAIARALGKTGKTDAGDIDAALQRLMDDGHVYTAGDDSHFLVCR